MKPLSIRIKVELDNIDKVIDELKSAYKKEYKSNLEISGMGALLHNFYSGIENILKQIFNEYHFVMPNDQSWHKTLLSEAVKNKIITDKVKYDLEKYLTFRHFFIHSYSFILKENSIKPLIKDVFAAYESVKKDIYKYL